MLKLGISGHRPPTATSGASIPMELGVASDPEKEHNTGEEEVNALRRLSPEELEDHKKRRLCFHCHRPGHISVRCPLKGAARK